MGRRTRLSPPNLLNRQISACEDEPLHDIKNIFVHSLLLSSLLLYKPCHTRIGNTARQRQAKLQIVRVIPRDDIDTLSSQ